MAENLPIQERKPKIPCDVCGGKSTRWFRETCVALCNNPECYNYHEESWQAELARLAEEEDY